jgi:hypothetical protein
VSANGLALPFLDDHRMLLAGMVVDLDDGSTRPPVDGERFWCPGLQSFQQAVEWFGADGSVRTDRRADGEVYPCDAGGHPSSGVPGAVPLAISSVTEDGLRMVATPSGVIAYRVPL